MKPRNALLIICSALALAFATAPSAEARDYHHSYHSYRGHYSGHYYYHPRVVYGSPYYSGYPAYYYNGYPAYAPPVYSPYGYYVGPRAGVTFSFGGGHYYGHYHYHR